MEQILLYIVTISGFSGLMLGVYSLLVPVLQRRGVRLPFGGRGDGDDVALDYDDELSFAANSFSARRGSLLERVPRQKTRSEPAAEAEEEDDDLDLEEELLGDLDLSKELAEVQAEDDDEEDDDELAALTFDAEVDPILEELAEDDGLEEAGGEEEEDEDEEDGEDEDDEEEYEDEDDEEEAEAEPQTPVVQVVKAGGGDDMLSLFDEASDAVKEIEAWRADLPSVSMEALVAEARELGALLKNRRPRA